MTTKDEGAALRKSIDELYEARRRTPNNRFENDIENILAAAKRDLARLEAATGQEDILLFGTYLTGKPTNISTASLNHLVEKDLEDKTHVLEARPLYTC